MEHSCTIYGLEFHLLVSLSLCVPGVAGWGSLWSCRLLPSSWQWSWLWLRAPPHKVRNWTCAVGSSAIYVPIAIYCQIRLSSVAVFFFSVSSVATHHINSICRRCLDRCITSSSHKSYYSQRVLTSPAFWQLADCSFCSLLQSSFFSVQSPSYSSSPRKAAVSNWNIWAHAIRSSCWL